MPFYKNIRLLYIIVFFQHLIPAYVIERIFWQERGMGIQMVVYCEIIYALTVALLEIPSGVLADRFSRKTMVLAGSIMACTEFFILIFSYHFWQFALVAFLAGIGEACTSGAANALLYDSLLVCNKQDKFEKILGYTHSVKFAASLIAALSGGFIAQLSGFVSNYWISTVSTVIALFAAFLLREPPQNRTDENHQPEFINITKQAAIFFKNNPQILSVIIHAVLIAACIKYVDEFWQLYLDAVSFPIVLFGVVSALITVVKIPGALAAGFLISRFKTKSLLISVSIAISAGITATSLLKSTAGVAVIAVTFFFGEIMELIATGYLHRRSDSNIRATAESVSSMIERVCSIGLGLIFGYISDKVSIFNGYLMLGITCFIISCVFGILYMSKKHAPH